MPCRLVDLGGTWLESRILSRTSTPPTQILTEAWHFIERTPTGVVLAEEEETHSLRWTGRWEMRHLLELGGFTVTAEYSDFHGSAPGHGRQQVWIVHRVP
ncbi:MAG: Type 11 methyltransferase [Rhodospirillaceae bacterium]|nr:MAG: Type 11 methyltransferase [Rhodospirillaceae bacterium]